MAVEYIQEKIGYRFGKSESLCLALKAAHRSDLYGLSDDGNRGLALIGTCAVEMTETYHTIIVEKGTSKELNTQDHWFKSKKKRALVCKELGIAQYVVQSVRQQNQAPSTEVLATALSAILGALWLDLHTQNGNFPIIVEQTYSVLRRMSMALGNVESVGTLLTPDPLTPLSIADEMKSPPSRPINDIQGSRLMQEYSMIMPNATLHQVEVHSAYDQPQSHDISESPGQYGTLHSCKMWTFRRSDTTPDFVPDFGFFDFGSDASGEIWNCIGLPNMDEVADTQDTGPPLTNEDAVVTNQGSVDTNVNAQPGTKGRKRKNRSEQGDKYEETTLHGRLLQEELEKSKYLPSYHPNDLEVLLDNTEIDNLDPDTRHVERLRLLYLTIGSCQSLIGFKEVLETARNLSSTHSNVSGPDIGPQERYAEICRLGKQEALCVLLRRYHIVKLFKITQAGLLQDSGVIVETPATRMTGPRAMPGNPFNRAQANLTEEVLAKILPGLANGSPIYQKTRKHVAHLRRLANILTVWTDVYGYGILPLLTPGPNQSGFHVTDYVQVFNASLDTT